MRMFYCDIGTIQMLGGNLLRPPVETVGVGADVVQPHLGLCLLGVRLEEDCFSVTTLGAGVILEQTNSID